MKKFILVLILLLLMFSPVLSPVLSPVFSETWIEVDRNDKCKIYWDTDIAVAYNQKQVFILVDEYTKTLEGENLSFNVYADTKPECLEAVEKGFYHIMKVYAKEATHYFICDNGVVIEITIKEEKRGD